MRRILALFSLLGALVVTGCAASAAPERTALGEQAGASALLERQGMTGLDARQIIDRLDALPLAQRPGELMASVRPTELVLKDAIGQASVPMPRDAFYLSLAPYSVQTHECFFHSLTTCLGERPSEAFQVTVVDDEGTIVLDEQRSSFANGFIGLWLPRDVAGTVRLADAAGRVGEVRIATDDSGATCLTTLRLA